MNFALSSINTAPRHRSLMRATVLIGTLLIFKPVCLAQKPAANEKEPAPTAKSAIDKTPLTDDERAELLKLIRSLQERVDKLEAAQAGTTARNEPTSEKPTTPTTAPAEPAASPANVQDQQAATQKKDEAKLKKGVPILKPWFEWEPGEGFAIAKSEMASLNISGYVAVRYLNQSPASQTSFTDHLGRTQTVRPRQDFQFHRAMVYLQGFVFNPKLYYNITLWTVNDTSQNAIIGALGYAFNKHVIAGVGWNALPGTRSLHGSHPYWPSYDRVMADEFFRPYFTQGLFVQGEIVHGLKYDFMLGNNLSNLDVKAVKLTRDLAMGGSLTWKPTTGEFGPRSAFGDFEGHEKFATQFGIAYTRSREDRQNPSDVKSTPENTTIRLADSLNLFENGALAPDVTVKKVTYQLYAADAGMKYKGFWLQAEGYYRILNNFEADGPLPLRSINDKGFYVQTSYMVVPKTFELYGATSWVFSQMGKPHEFLGGANYYPFKNRNFRMNLHAINVYKSPVNSTFGFYTGGLKGWSISAGSSVLF